MSVIRVHSKQPSRWRAGRQFGAQPVEIDTAELGKGDLALLKGDPQLVVEEIGEPKAPASKSPAGKGAAGQ